MLAGFEQQVVRHEHATELNNSIIPFFVTMDRMCQMIEITGINVSNLMKTRNVIDSQQKLYFC